MCGTRDEQGLGPNAVELQCCTPEGSAEKRGEERGRRREAKLAAGEAQKGKAASGGDAEKQGRGRRRRARRGAGETQKSKAGSGGGTEKHDRDQREGAAGQARMGGRLRASSITTRATARDKCLQSHLHPPVFGGVQAALAAGEKIDL